MKMKRYLMMSLTLGLCLVMLFGGIQTGAGASAPAVSDVSGHVRISFAGAVLEDGINPISGESMRGLISFFKDEFDPLYPNITYEISTVPWETYVAKQRTQLIGGEVDVISAGGLEAIFWNEGLIRDLEDLIAKDASFDPAVLFPEGIWASNTHVTSEEGDHFGFPLFLGRRMTTYDKTLFEQWGVEPLSEKPTPEEVLEKAAKMTGTNPVTGEYNYGLWLEGNSWDGPLFRALTYAYDAPGAEGKLTDPKNLKWDLTSDNMVKVMEWLTKAAAYCNPAFVNKQGNEQWGFDDNNIAIYLDEPGLNPWGNYIATGDDTIMERFVPCYNLGPNGEGYVAVDSVMIAKDAKDVDAAWEVMKFFASPAFAKYQYLEYQMTSASADTSFLDPKDVYTQMAMKIAEHAHSDMLGDDNPFFISDMVPKINSVISDAANGNAVDIPAFLAQLQTTAEAWSAAQ